MWSFIPVGGLGFSLARMRDFLVVDDFNGTGQLHGSGRSSMLIGIGEMRQEEQRTGAPTEKTRLVVWCSSCGTRPD
jgi:hypothetical protein